VTDSIRALLIEDSEADAQLITESLRARWPQVEVMRVQAAAAVRAALTTGKWDVVVCDWSLESFGALEALGVLGELALEIPFVVVSGTAGLDIAVEAIRTGAKDYVLKGELGRLAPVIERELTAAGVRRALEVHRRQEERFFNLSPELLAIVALDGTLVRLNPAWHETLGRSIAELIAHPWWELLHPDDLETTQTAYASIQVQGGKLPHLENRLRCKDGTYRHVIWSVVAFPGDQVSYVAGRDITKRKDAELALRSSEDQLRQSQKLDAIGTLAAGLAHDFNNLLSVIISYTALMREGLKHGDPLLADLDEVGRAAERATDLTRQLLAFGRRQVLEPTVADLGPVITGMERMLRRVLRGDVELVVMFAADVGQIYVDTGQLEQVLMNLAVNARDAMPCGGKLTIEISNIDLDATYARDHAGVTAGPHVLLAVADTGTGMDAATHARMFEPFFTTKPEGKGTGLGLASVFGIVQQSGGHMAVESELGRGTRFLIYFPRTDRVEAAAMAALPVITSRRGSETILLVEDDEQLRTLACMLLRRSHYKVLEARNAGEALLIAEQHPGPIELLVTGVVMKLLSGAQLAERLNALRPALRVLFMSGYPDEVVTLHGLPAGGDFLAKPISPDGLLGKVREVLDATGTDRQRRTA